MSKLLILGGATILSAYAFRKVTEFETNVIVKGKSVNPCLIGNKNTIDTDQGSFVTGRDVWTRQFNSKGVYDDMTNDLIYHVTGYGLDYPKLHLYKKIVSQNGTPCDLNHCQEKPSLLSTISSKI